MLIALNKPVGPVSEVYVPVGPTVIFKGIGVDIWYWLGVPTWLMILLTLLATA